MKWCLRCQVITIGMMMNSKQVAENKRTEVKEAIPCSRNTVYKIMKENNIKSKQKAK